MASQSSKGQIVYLFSLMVMVFTILSFVSVQELNKSNRTRTTDELIENIHNVCLNVFKTDVDFFAYELNNVQYFSSLNSTYLNRHDSLVRHADNLIAKATEEENISIDSDLVHIHDILLKYDSIFKKVHDGILKKGFGRFGLEGEMRKSASALRESNLLNDKEYFELQMLEKEYLLTYDSALIRAFKSRVLELNKKYRSKEGVGLLEHYAKALENLVSQSDLIGLETQSGLKAVLNTRTDDLVRTLTTLGHKSDSATEDSRNKGITMLLFAVIGSALLCVVIIILIMRKL